MLDTLIELHDSKITNVSWLGDTATFSLVVNIHRSEGRAGIDAGSVWQQQIEIQLNHAALTGDIPELPDYIYDGRMDIDSTVYDNTIPYQLDCAGEILLKLIFTSGNEIMVHCQRAKLTLIGDAEYLEEFPGQNGE